MDNRLSQRFRQTLFDILARVEELLSGLMEVTDGIAPDRSLV
jgi:hypothetical protein